MQFEALKVGRVELILADQLVSPLQVLLELLGNLRIHRLLFEEIDDAFNVAGHGFGLFFLLLNQLQALLLDVLDLLHAGDDLEQSQGSEQTEDRQSQVEQEEHVGCYNNDAIEGVDELFQEFKAIGKQFQNDLDDEEGEHDEVTLLKYDLQHFILVYLLLQG